MKEELICLNSDAINRYGYLVHTLAMEKSLKKDFNLGVPLLLGHDFHKIAGWTYPFGLFIEPGMSRMLARKLIATDVQELKYFRTRVEKFLSFRYQEHFVKHETDFIPLVKNYLTDQHLRIDSGCCAIIQNGIADNMFPELFENLDKDGLISLEFLLSKFNYLGQGIFQHKVGPLTVYAHSYFRRSQSRLNNFRFWFLDKLLSLSNVKDIHMRIRLDKDMIGYGPSYHESGELEFHWGPRYTDDISNIPHGIALHKCTDIERRFTEISSTEFYWKKVNDQRIFEVEELTDNPSPVSNENFHCRYVHSIYDVKKQAFQHFDGAIRSYDYEAMMDRVSKNFIQYGKKAQYKKLFRLDGKISLDIWKTLITHYYQGNPLIYEYFGLKNERDSYKGIETPMSKYQELMPYEIKKEQGLRLLVSYHEQPEDFKQGRYVDILDVMTNKVGKIYCLEHMVYEVKKMLKRFGEDLEIPGDISLIKIDDRYWNIPSIMHNGPNPEQMLETTIRALKTLFDEMINLGMESVVSLSLAFPLNNRVVRISSYGHMCNQLEWLKNNFPFAHTEEALTEWVCNQRDYLNRYETNIDSPIISALTQADGVLYIKRVPILFQYDLNSTEVGLEYHLYFPDNDESRNLFFNGKIRPALCTEVIKAIWPDSGENYFTSSRSKMTERITLVHIVDAEALALYWTSTEV